MTSRGSHTWRPAQFLHSNPPPESYYHALPWQIVAANSRKLAPAKGRALIKYNLYPLHRSTKPQPFMANADVVKRKPRIVKTRVKSAIAKCKAHERALEKEITKMKKAPGDNNQNIIELERQISEQREKIRDLGIKDKQFETTSNTLVSAVETQLRNFRSAAKRGTFSAIKRGPTPVQLATQLELDWRDFLVQSRNEKEAITEKFQRERQQLATKGKGFFSGKKILLGIIAYDKFRINDLETKIKELKGNENVVEENKQKDQSMIDKIMIEKDNLVTKIKRMTIQINKQDKQSSEQSETATEKEKEFKESESVYRQNIQMKYDKEIQDMKQRHNQIMQDKVKFYEDVINKNIIIRDEYLKEIKKYKAEKVEFRATFEQKQKNRENLHEKLKKMNDTLRTELDQDRTNAISQIAQARSQIARQKNQIVKISRELNQEKDKFEIKNKQLYQQHQKINTELRKCTQELLDQKQMEIKLKEEYHSLIEKEKNINKNQNIMYTAGLQNQREKINEELKIRQEKYLVELKQIHEKKEHLAKIVDQLKDNYIEITDYVKSKEPRGEASDLRFTKMTDQHLDHLRKLHHRFVPKKMKSTVKITERAAKKLRTDSQQSFSHSFPNTANLRQYQLNSFTR